MIDNKVMTFDAARHRPGFRYASDEQRAASDKAYAEMVARASNAWRTPQRVEQDTEIACVIGRDQSMIADAQARRDAAYWRMVEEARNAWKSA
jgi:hypothetical protein